ncbi:YopX family protein [Clostridium chrysemydis]|uniref:YopX family protein n=1 Tax=Clostridium chrysemydis TaxID=2665504 RepID=UPI003F2ACBFA
METIKFRGKDINGKWHYGDLLNMTEKDEETGELIKGCAIVSLGINETMEEPREGVAVEIYESEIVIVDPSTVGQFTGLTDKNGVEIYDGDLLKTNEYCIEEKDCEIYEIFYSSTSGACMISEMYPIEDGNAEYAGGFRIDEMFEVCGNIHDK